jgi:hypothetical protein
MYRAAANLLAVDTYVGIVRATASRNLAGQRADHDARGGGLRRHVDAENACRDMLRKGDPKASGESTVVGNLTGTVMMREWRWHVASRRR